MSPFINGRFVIMFGQSIIEGQVNIFDFMQMFSSETTEHTEAATNDGASVVTNIKQPAGNAAVKQQFVIPDDFTVPTSKKERFDANVKAIQIVKACEKEDRPVTPEEQEILASYVGWGSLSEAFSEKSKSTVLKNLLSVEEYTSAEASTLTAFYTPPVVIKAIYQALGNMGLRKGNLLDPCCGTGHFIGGMPDLLSGCKVYAVELDEISGKIAKLLYPEADISICGFENSSFSDNSFDVVVGNFPFGQIKILDRRYDKYHFSIHDYFIAKALDLVRPGGVLAFITSSWTMDKHNASIREYIAARANLLGAVRLPDNTFKKNAGTEVTSDILFLQKKDCIENEKPDWIELDETEDGIVMNRYFIEHPQMVLGKMTMVSSQYGEKTACKAFKNVDFENQLFHAISEIRGTISNETSSITEDSVEDEIPADLSVKNYSFTLVDDKLYFRENSVMRKVSVNATARERIIGMLKIRDCVKELIKMQMDNSPFTMIRMKQVEINDMYDKFTKKYGLLNRRGNKVFSDDCSYPLLCSLEILDDAGRMVRKADMFTKQTIKPYTKVFHVESSAEALAVSIAEKAGVDMEYMEYLTNKPEDEIESDLRGVIFRLPYADDETGTFVTADTYLSGNVREKLETAKEAAKTNPAFLVNVEALQKVQPVDLNPSEISVRLGAAWIPASDVEDFMIDLLNLTPYDRNSHHVEYNPYTGSWTIQNKNSGWQMDVIRTYGTQQATAYRLMEDALNQKDTRIYDYNYDDQGKCKAVVNRKKTAVVQGKQDIIKQKFLDWIWQDDDRRERLLRTYNDKYNSTRPREYDGSNLSLVGMNPTITLNKHQLDGIARVIYGGNTLLAHVVGAGKTYSMAAAAMEMKRLGICSKSMVVVPNHIIEQFASEWLNLYPAANLLVATKKDFQKENRRKFCARIATSDIDAVIIGQSQFERIPISPQRRRQQIQDQIDEIEYGIEQSGCSLSVKEMQRMRKNLMIRLETLNDLQRKDGCMYFEELGIDRLFIDEADSYKNLFTYTKMTNVGGISQSEAQKSSDLFAKCRYMDEITGSKGVIFATGTPISNSMVEMFTMQKYLQYNVLERNDLLFFDNWASTFGETVSAIELSPEGTGYRMKTRFAKFYNLPELMSMFKEVADIKTSDMLDLPVPEAHYRVVSVKPTEDQKRMLEELSERADLVRDGQVDPSEDNMLKITNDGRKLALDQRICDSTLPDVANSKVNACVNEVYRYWIDGAEDRLTQLIFCDLSTPGKGGFNVYDDLKAKLIRKGIPKEEIAFIHDANTDQRKKELFAKVRNGTVRVLIGSTFKMGAGTNVQDRIIASHDLDIPWRPRDLEQRAGRTIRQGNRNKQVEIIRYITEGTFDAYMYQTLESKQKFIAQIMTSKSPARSAEDIDETALSYAEIKALASGNPLIKEKMTLDAEVAKLNILRQSFMDQIYKNKTDIVDRFPKRLKYLERTIEKVKEDIEKVQKFTPESYLTDKAFPGMRIRDIFYEDETEAGKALIEAAACGKHHISVISIGTYRGLELGVREDVLKDKMILEIGYDLSITLGSSGKANIKKINAEIDAYGDRVSAYEAEVESILRQMESAKDAVTKAFPYQEQLEEKSKRLAELNALLELDKPEHVVMGAA